VSTASDEPRSEGTDATTDWFESAFDSFYAQLYAHRDRREAARLIETLDRRFGLRGGVLDLACGGGRFLQVMEDRGLRPFGLDLSSPLLAGARAGLAHPRLLRADMRRIPFRGASFDWVLLLFTSFGYFATPEEDAEVLDEVARILRPGGRFLLDYLNAATTRSGLVPESTRTIDSYRVREIRRIDEGGPYLRKEVLILDAAGAPVRSYEERVRLYERDQLVALLAGHALASDQVMGDYDGGAFEEDRSDRLLLVAYRKDRR